MEHSILTNFCKISFLKLSERKFTKTLLNRIGFCRNLPVTNIIYNDANNQLRMRNFVVL